MRSKKVLLVVIAFITMSFNNFTGITEAERKHASNVLQETQDDLIKKLAGLTPAQLAFKADTASWSIAECVEHLAISEDNIFDFIKTALKVPADPSKRSEVKMSDEAVFKMVADRGTRVKTREAFKPAGKFGNYEETLKAFKARRENSIKYIKTTSDDLRNHYKDFHFGKLDAYQVILFMAGHSKRHTGQIEEIMSHVNFPENGK